ncbi:MAG: hypothetical protein KF764_01565 [Labilithrix sp.]|nr:hypothetical protein [Labilithrix sp.]MBX3220576.1 hypothetical protein [Labilithrix sp.]
MNSARWSNVIPMVEVQSAANTDVGEASALVSPRPAAFDSAEDGPASAPTILVEVDAHALPTVLPAPPKLPTALGAWCAPPSVRPQIRSLSLVSDATHDSRRPTVRAPAHRSRKILRIVRRSSPPTIPPTGSTPMRRAA